MDKSFGIFHGSLIYYKRRAVAEFLDNHLLTFENSNFGGSNILRLRMFRRLTSHFRGQQ